MDEQNRQKFFLVTASKNCHLNLFDLNKLRGSLNPELSALSESAEGADHIVVNSCGFSKRYENRSLEMLEEYRRRFPGKKVILAGCLPAINRARVKKEFGGPTIGVDEWDKLNTLVLPEIVKNTVPPTANVLKQPDIHLKKQPVMMRIVGTIAPAFYRLQLAMKHEYQPMNNFLQGYIVDPLSYGVLIGQGCTGHCKFCAIKMAKGRVRSRPLAEILSEIRTGLASGYRRFHLISDDGGCWGYDLGSDLSVLLNAILDIPEDFKVNVYYVDPSWFLRLFEKLKRPLSDPRVNTLAVTIQSGSNSLINAMGRDYDINLVYERIAEIRRLNPSLILRTHLIVGYPGERTRDVLSAIRALRYFHMTGIYIYSERAGTPAAKLPGKIPRVTQLMRFTFLGTFVFFRHLQIVSEFLFKFGRDFLLSGDVVRYRAARHQGGGGIEGPAWQGQAARKP